MRLRTAHVGERTANAAADIQVFADRCGASDVGAESWSSTACQRQHMTFIVTWTNQPLGVYTGVIEPSVGLHPYPLNRPCTHQAPSLTGLNGRTARSRAPGSTQPLTPSGVTSTTTNTLNRVERACARLHQDDSALRAVIDQHHQPAADQHLARQTSAPPWPMQSATWSCAPPCASNCVASPCANPLRSPRESAP